jgi:hypothetical protein
LSVGTRNDIPVNFPSNDGITLPTALAAPVDDGIILPAAALPSRHALPDAPSTVF